MKKMPEILRTDHKLLDNGCNHHWHYVPGSPIKTNGIPQYYVECCFCPAKGWMQTNDFACHMPGPHVTGELC